MQADNDAMEHRWGTRFVLDAPVELSRAKVPIGKASIRNASLSGAFVETALPVPVLSRLALRVLPGNVWLQASVVRVADSGFAVEWLEPGLGSVVALLSQSARANRHAPIPGERRLP